jgi:broad specificity phosphatase PhoE
VLEIEKRRAMHVTEPFPNGESYEQVAARVSRWLADAATTFAGQRMLVIGHRATFYALEHLFKGVPLVDVVTSTWQWQPGWTYRRALRIMPPVDVGPMSFPLQPSIQSAPARLLPAFS